MLDVCCFVPLLVSKWVALPVSGSTGVLSLREVSLSDIELAWASPAPTHQKTYLESYGHISKMYF